MRADGRLVALDIDGTVLTEDGELNPPVRRAILAARARGHEVMLATGRSAASTIPVARAAGIDPEYLVCANGAVTLKRDASAQDGYRREFVETFDPTEVLGTIRAALSDALFAVEDEEGFFRYTERFPASAVGPAGEQVDWDDLLTVRATRVVVVSPTSATEEFLGAVERMGLHRVSYAVGWTAWLDIAPDGVNKATAMERVRKALDVPRDRVVAAGDGRNDIDLLEWASAEGVGAAMGQAPPEVHRAAGELLPPVTEDGLATLLDRLP
ncbi:HAD family hydrolase [Amnibacterium endophyticum]|uniref:HAD family hydrolase n=1 Tax=Amnibacterium endophyticum TaxID=2109337 RepID=A0ABW4LGH6_9MICO